jgi:hypothetical protein
MYSDIRENIIESKGGRCSLLLVPSIEEHSKTLNITIYRKTSKPTLSFYGRVSPKGRICKNNNQCTALGA